MSPTNTAVAHVDFRGATTLPDLAYAVQRHLWPGATEQQRRHLILAQEMLADANDKLNDAALSWGNAVDAGAKARADMLRSYIKDQHGALATYLHVVAVVAEDPDMLTRADQVRDNVDHYVQAFEAVLNATVAGAEASPAATVH